jgi:hypothetical protein
VEGTAELPAVSANAGSLGEILGRRHLDYADLLPRPFRGRMLRDLGKRYLGQASVYRQTDRPHFIDKMPSNWMHLGLIRLMLPNALLVDVRRNALDCCFSNFAQAFPTLAMNLLTDWRDVAAQYRDYELLTALLRPKSLPGALIRVSYEQLVARPERLSGSFWPNWAFRSIRPACNISQAADRSGLQAPSKFASRSTSVGSNRWRPYAEWLGPLIEGLAVGREREPSN